ncbi:hypothetical protein Emed_003444 [Eimeria media]
MGDVSALSLAGGQPQSDALLTGVENAPDSTRLLRASVPRQARHRVSHRTLLGAATASVAIFAVTFLILVCARRLSSLSVARGGPRSLAGAEGDEPAGACGGILPGEDEDEKREGDEVWQQAVLEQARKNIEGYRRVISKLVRLKSGPPYKAVQSAKSVYTLLISEMGALGAFVNHELLALRHLWLEVMTEAIESAEELQTIWVATHKTSALTEAFEANENLIEFISTMKTAKEKRQADSGEGLGWAALRRLVLVQPVAIDVACRHLDTIHPESGATRRPRRQAVGELSALADVRRTMILANRVFAAYFKRFVSRGVARQKFGSSCGSQARAANPPLAPEDQINQLQEMFPREPRIPSPGEAAAVVRRSPPGSRPSSKQKGHPKQPAGTPVKPLGAPAQPQGPSMPGGPPGAELPSASYSGTGMEKLSRSTLVSERQPRTTSTVETAWYEGPRRRRRRRLDFKAASSKDVALSGEGEAPSEPWEEAEGGTAQGTHASLVQVAEALAALALAEEEESTAGVGGEVEPVHISGGGFLRGSQAEHARLPMQGQVPFPSSSWAAQGIPMGIHTPGVEPSSSPPVNPFFGVAQGAPRPPPPRPSLPPEFMGPPPHFAGPVRQILQRPSGPFGDPSGSFSMSSSFTPSPPAGFPGFVTETLQAPAGPLGESHEVPGSRFLTPSLPSAFSGSSAFEGPASHMLQEPTGPFGPLPSTSGDPFHASPLGTVQHLFVSSDFPPLPSRPFSSGPLPPPPPQPSGPLRVSSPLPSDRSPPFVSSSVPSVLGSFPPLSATPGIWGSSLYPVSLPFFSRPHTPSFPQPSFMGPSPLGPSTPSASAPPSSDSPPTQAGHRSRISGVFRGTPMGEPMPSDTSVTTPPPS